MAYSLKKLGFTDVTILERSNRIGGKGEHFQYRGIKHPLSIIIWTSDYKDTLVPLLTHFGFLKNGSNGVDWLTFWLTNDRSLPILEATQYAISWVMKNLNITTVNEAQLKVLQDLNRYTDIYKDLFGTFQYGLMRKPDYQMMQHLNGTIFQFLQRNNLLALIPLFKNIFHTTGYGFVQCLY